MTWVSSNKTRALSSMLSRVSEMLFTVCSTCGLRPVFFFCTSFKTFSKRVPVAGVVLEGPTGALDVEATGGRLSSSFRSKVWRVASESLFFFAHV